MKSTEIRVSKNTDFSEAEKIIEGCCEKDGLKITLKGTLSKYPSSVHWHFKKDKMKGTLEITLSKIEGRAWFSVQDGRKAKWINASIKKIKPKIGFVENL